MQQDELEQWVDATGKSHKRRRPDDAIERYCKRTKVAPPPPPQQRSKSVGDPPSTDYPGPWNGAVDAFANRINAYAADMAGLAPSPRGSQTEVVGPASVPFSRYSSPCRSSSYTRRRPRSRSSSPARSDSGTSLALSRIDSPAYRQLTLEPNHVYIKYLGAPRDIYEKVAAILSGSGLPLVDPEENDDATKRRMEGLVEREEGTIKQTLVTEFWRNLLGCNPRSLHVASSSSFWIETVSHAERLPRFTDPPAILNPRPDLLYGFSNEVWTSNDSEAMRLAYYKTGKWLGQGCSCLCWPFLFARFKSQAQGQNMYIAANQAAAGGSACTRAVSLLLETALSMKSESERVTSPAPTRPDSITFSLAADAETASLFVNWHDKPQSFYVHRVRSYVLHRPVELRELKAHIAKILAWALDEQLGKIKEAFCTIYEAGMRAGREQQSAENGTTAAVPASQDI